MVDLVASFDLWVGRSNACCRICSQQKQPKILQHIIYLRDSFMLCLCHAHLQLPTNLLALSSGVFQIFQTWNQRPGFFEVPVAKVNSGSCPWNYWRSEATTKPQIHHSCRHWFSGVFDAFVMGWYHVNIGDGGRTAASKCDHLQRCDLGLWLHSKSPSLMFWNSWWAVNSVTSGVKSMDVNVCTSHPICNQQ